MVVHVDACPCRLLGPQFVEDGLDVLWQRFPFIHIHDHGKGVYRAVEHGDVLAHFSVFEIFKGLKR